MTTFMRRAGYLTLMLSHCAGMIDLVALPIWVGVLIARFDLDPQQAGGLATLFLVGAVASSLASAPRLQNLPRRAVASAGFAIAAAAFFEVPFATSYVWKAALHLVAGAATGAALSMVHGTIGRSERPQRLFALAGAALGVFGVIFMALVPRAVAGGDSSMLFKVFAAVMVVGAMACAIAFPSGLTRSAGAEGTAREPITAAAWAAMLGVTCMAIVQAMTFSFVERMGMDRSFGVQAVTSILIALGLVNLLPAPLAALTEKRWSARTVLLVGPILQGLAALLLANGTALPVFAAGALMFTAVLIFTHTFAFGLLSRLDPTGRAVAATPAMVMVGSAIGPVLGGTLVKSAGYHSLGLASVAFDLVALALFVRMRRHTLAMQMALPR